MRCHYLATVILTTASGTAFAFTQPLMMTRPSKTTTLMASNTPEGPESELFDFLKSIVEKPIDWNMNEPGKSPFGFDKNAEIWNGRIAQISFVWIFIQEWIQGKGVLQSIPEGDLASNISLEVVCLMLLFISFRFCMLPFEQDVKVRIPLEWLENPPPVKPPPPEKQETVKPDMRTWNLNGENKAPYGIDINAEVWNGRVAMVCFAWVFLQEWIQDKGLLVGLEEKHGPSEAALLLFVIGLSGFITYLHNMFSLEAEAFRKLRAPPATEALKSPSTTTSRTFNFSQTNGDVRALNGQQNLVPRTQTEASGTLTSSMPPRNIIPRESMTGREWPTNGSYSQNVPLGNFMEPNSTGRSPPRPNLPQGNLRPGIPPTKDPFRPNFQPESSRQSMTPGTPQPNYNSFRPNQQPGSLQSMGPGTPPPNNYSSYQPNQQPGNAGQAVRPGVQVAAPTNSYNPNLRSGSFGQAMDPSMPSANGSSGPDGRAGDFRQMPGDSSVPDKSPVEESMIKSYEESLRSMTKETTSFPSAKNQQGLQYGAQRYPEPPRATTPDALDPSTPQRTQLFKTDALSSVAKGDPSFLDQITPDPSMRANKEIIQPETKPGIRPFPKPESFSFNPPIAQLAKSSVDQPWAKTCVQQPDWQSSGDDEMTRSLSESPPDDTASSSRRETRPDLPLYSSGPAQARYQSSPYNMPDPQKRTSYLDKLGPT